MEHELVSSYCPKEGVPGGIYWWCSDCKRIYTFNEVTKDTKCPRNAGYPCNMCAGSCIPKHGGTIGTPYGLHSVIAAGYHSPTLEDSFEYRFRLCETCVAEVMKTFKIPAERRNYFSGGEWYSYRAEQDRK